MAGLGITAHGEVNKRAEFFRKSCGGFGSCAVLKDAVC